MIDQGARMEELTLPDDPIELAKMLAEKNMADGLPVVPPTPERLAKMLEQSPYEPDREIGWMPPVMGLVSPRFIALNAIMAGCSPEHMPVLCAAADAMMDPAFNLLGISTTTNPCAPLLVVHGPERHRLKMNIGAGCFGPGNYANAVLGRAIRFMLLNLGGAVPGETDRATQGMAIKYTFCAPENAEETPWAPFHARRGYQADDNAVTVFGIQAQHNMIDLTAENGEELLRVLVPGMAAYATNNMTHGGEALLLISPEHATMLARTGWDPESIQKYMYEHARYDVREAPERFVGILKYRRPPWVDMAKLPVVDRWEDMQVMVIGGTGIHAQFLPSFGSTTAITRKIVYKE